MGACAMLQTPYHLFQNMSSSTLCLLVVAWVYSMSTWRKLVEGHIDTPCDRAHPNDALKDGEKEASPKRQYCSLQILGTKSSDMRPSIIVLKHDVAQLATYTVLEGMMFWMWAQIRMWTQIA